MMKGDSLYLLEKINNRVNYMKQLLIILIFLIVSLSLSYPQQLKKADESKKPDKIKMNIPVDNQYKVSASSFTESFESTTFPPTGWTNLHSDGGNGWSRQTAGSQLPGWTSGTISTPTGGGNAVAYCTWNTTTIYNNQTLVTPFIQNIQPSDTLFFWMRNQVNNPDTIYIYYSTDGTNWNDIGHVIYPNSDGTNWGKWYVAIGEKIPTGSNVYLAFQEFVTNNTIYGGAISLDLVEIKGTEAVNAPTAVTNNATNIASTSATLNGTVNPNNSSTSVIFEYGTTITYGNSINAAQNPVSGTTGINVSTNLTGLQPNTTYHYRVKATNNGGVSNGNDISFSTTIPYPSSITLSKTFSFNDLSQSSYRMIGLPGNQATKISDMITGTPKKDWDAFYDNGATSNFLQEFDGSSIFNFTAGKGFWILSKNPFTINATVNTVTLAADNTFSIALHSGFNIISNPFDKSISWADIQNLNGLTTNDILFDWTGAWIHATQMEPYKGYYFKKPDNINSLKIPYNFSTAKISSLKSAENYSGNLIQLSLIQNNKVKSYTVAGFNSSAKKDYDKFDIFAPPGYFDEVRINIEDKNISDQYKQLSVDYRPNINEGQTFDLKIKNTTKQAIKLIADGVKNFSNYEVYLLDKNLNKFYNLKEQNEINLSPVHEKYDFQLLIGNEGYINNIKKGDVPTEYVLFQNYPNPFNPSTLIKYQIKDNNTFVELKVFNILGKEVKTLVNEIQDSGIHEVEFNASNLSSGVYFYTIKTGSYSATKKMILIK